MAADHNTQPLLTVVVPVRDRVEIVTRTLDSIASQTCRPFRLTIVDNGSTDGTRELVERWARSHSDESLAVEVLSEPKPGAAAARNRGLTAVTTPYVCFFDSDDVMTPGHLQSVADELKRMPDTDILYFDVATVDSDGWSTVKSVNDSDVLRGHIFHSSLSTLRYVALTGLVREAGGWDEECSYWDDYELGVRLLLSAKNVRKLHGEPQVYIYSSEESISGPSFLSRAGLGEVALDKIERSLSAAGLTLPLKWVDCRRAILAANYRREGGAPQAHALLDSVLERQTAADMLRLRLVYAVQRLFGSGGSMLSRYLFAPPKVKRKRGE